MNISCTDYIVTLRCGALLKLLQGVALCLCLVEVSRAAIPPSERAALQAFYVSTNGPAWKRSDNWNGAVGTECTWYGIQCSVDQTTVISLEMYGNSLSGSISDLSEFPNLQIFDVSQNSLTGSIPPLASLINLQYLTLHNNRLTGVIPPIATLTNLLSIDVGQNQLSGAVPPISGMASLQELRLIENKLSGQLPSPMGLTNLQRYTVYYNQFTGPLPQFSGLTNLISIDVYGNQLTGTIPSLTNLPSLVALTLSDNQFTGTLQSLADFPALAYVDVRDNQLSGTLPDLSGLPKLEYFYASNNQFTGTVPSLSGLTVLEDFEVDHNALTGSIPTLSGLPSIQYFVVGWNKLSGPLPAAPPTLYSGYSSICPNTLSPISDAAWDKATGVSPWYTPCVNSPLTVTPSAGPKGTISPSTPVAVASGTTATFTVYSANGYGTRMGGSCGPDYVTLGTVEGAYYTTNPISADCTVTATFIPIPTLTLTTARNPAPDYHPITFTATVVGLDTAPSGSVVFASMQLSGTLCEAPLVPSSGNVATAACTTTLLQNGNQGFTAAYNGDINYAPASGQTFVTGITPATITTLATDTNPVLQNQSFVLTAVVSGNFSPTGTVSFEDSFPGNILCAAAPLVNSAGKLTAQCRTSLPYVLRDSITATYSGDASNDSSSGNIDETVTYPPLSTSATVSSSSISSPLGASITFTAVIDGGYAPTGTVLFQDGENTLCSTLLSGTGTVTCQVHDLTIGLHAVSASYSGDAHNTASNSVAIQQEIRHAGGFVPLLPARLLDTRSTGATIDGQFAGAGAVESGHFINLPVLGRGGVPRSGVVAAVINLTATNSNAATYITAWPGGTSQPFTSSLNLQANQTRPNLVIVPLGSAGEISLFNSAGSTDLVADIEGYFSSQSTFVPIAASRILDTRLGTTTIDSQFGGIGALAPAGILNLQIDGRVGMPNNGVGAVVMNVTAINPTAPGYLSAWPTGTTQPFVSNLNFAPAQTIPNLLISSIGTTGQVSLFNSAGRTDYVSDAIGWFPPYSELAHMAPARFLDTRGGASTVDGLYEDGGSLQPNAEIDLPIAGRGIVPMSGVTAVVLNVTATNPSASTFITLWPSTSPRPNASNLNVVEGQTAANLVIAQIGANGAVSIYNSAGSTDMIVDVLAWF